MLAERVCGDTAGAAIPCNCSFFDKSECDFGSWPKRTGGSVVVGVQTSAPSFRDLIFPLAIGVGIGLFFPSVGFCRTLSRRVTLANVGVFPTSVSDSQGAV